MKTYANFTIGQRVINICTKELGTVKNFECGMIGIRFDNFDFYKHALGGRCEMGYGWYSMPSDIKPLEIDKNDIRKMTFSRGKFELKGGD